MTEESKAFEQLVAQIEGCLAGKGGVVTSPEHIVGRNTKTTRECDATIRVGAGSTELMVLIECRKQSGVQGIQWIEQLATKADDVGADRVVAVSATRFSKGARILAHAKRIELRQLEEVTGDDIDLWCQLLATRTTIQWVANHVEVEFFVEDGNPAPEPLQEHLQRFFREQDAPLLFLRKSGAPISLNQLIASAGQASDEGLTPNGPAMERMLRGEFPRGEVWMPTDRGDVDVRSVRVQMSGRLLRTTLPAIRYARYHTPDGATHMSRVDYEFKKGDTKLTLSIDYSTEEPEGHR